VTELEYIVVDLVRKKRLELVKGTHVLGLSSLFSISFVYLDVRHLRHSTTTSYLRVPVSVLCIQSRFRCSLVALQVGFHFATLVSPAGRIRIPFRRYDPSVPLLDYPSPPSLSQASFLEKHLSKITRLDPSSEAPCRIQAAPTPGQRVSIPMDQSTSSLPNPRALLS
jgi:hypothetical protein